MIVAIVNIGVCLLFLLVLYGIAPKAPASQAEKCRDKVLRKYGVFF